MAGTPTDSVRQAIPLRGRPRHWRPLARGYALLVATLAVATVPLLSFQPPIAVVQLYALLHVGVLLTAPIVVGVAVATFDGGLLRAVGAGALPAPAWALASVVGRALARSVDVPVVEWPYLPLWAIVSAYLAFGVVGSLAGFLVGRGWVAVSPRFAVDSDGRRQWQAAMLAFGVAIAALVTVTLAMAMHGGAGTQASTAAILVAMVATALPAAVAGARGGRLLPALALGAAPVAVWFVTVFAGSGAEWILRGAPPRPLPSTLGLSFIAYILSGLLLAGVVAAAVGFGLGRAGIVVRRRRT